MANILIKIGTILILIFNIYNPMVEATGKNFKQGFYIITEGQKSHDIKQDLDTLNDMKVPIFIVINPYKKMNKNLINMLQEFQEDQNTEIILQDVSSIETTYFVSKEYDKKLKVSGLCNITGDKLYYMGEKNIVFDLIDIYQDPLETILEVNKIKGDSNYALLLNGNDFNLSTFLLTYQGLPGGALDIGDYRLEFKKPNLINMIITYIGDITIIFFLVSIIIFSVAIVIFKKWSNKNFIN